MSQDDNDDNTKKMYMHGSYAGNPSDVFKHVIFCAAVQCLQEHYPEGILLVDAHAGQGLYDVSNQPMKELESDAGIARIWNAYETQTAAAEAAATQEGEETTTTTTTTKPIPRPILDYLYWQSAATGHARQNGTTTLYAGSPLLGKHLLQRRAKGVDHHRLCDWNVPQVLNLYDDNDDDDDEHHQDEEYEEETPLFEQIDCYTKEGLEFMMPTPEEEETAATQKHPVIFLDPPYRHIDEYPVTKRLVERILDRNPSATVMVYIPLVEKSRFRWSYAVGLKDLAKEKAKIGRYYGAIVLSPKGLQGNGFLIVNPTPDFDQVINEETLAWLATCMQQGKDEFTVEQYMKKTKLTQTSIPV